MEQKCEAKDYFLILGELDYCHVMLTNSLKNIQKDMSDSEKPINKLIDATTGYSGVNWENVAIVIYWAEQVILRQKKLDFPFDAAERLQNRLKSFMVKNGKELFFNKVIEELGNN